MRKRLALSLAAVSLLVGACGAGSSSTGASHVMPDGSTMSGSSMPGMGAPQPSATQRRGQGAAGPSQSASMICSTEIRTAVQHGLQTSQVPVGLHAWQHHTYNCTYQLAGGDLRLSVKDLDAAAPGLAYYDHLRSLLPKATTIRGLPALGLPAFETPPGDVVFIKDHKTLWVDATHLMSADLPAGTSRADVAYGVAAAVIACWTE